MYMDRENAIKLLKLHSDLNKENGYLYTIKEKNIVNPDLFREIMDCLIVLSKELIEKEQIKDIYSIVFWCRSWLDAGWIEKQLGSDTKERLRMLHDFYRTGEETSFNFELSKTMRKGHNFKDYICPDSVEFENDYLKMGERYARVLFLKEYASYIKDSMVTELTELNK